MEGAGSRLGRAASRYGTPTVFSGPVRKWKKKWVQVSSPGLSKSNSQSHSTANNNGGSRLLLCRWTPITSSDGESDKGSDTVVDEPPRRKFRYTPIAALQEQKKTAFKKEDEPEINETDPYMNRPANTGSGKYADSEGLGKEAEDDLEENGDVEGG